MILLFTDFGVQGPYVGQMHATLNELAPATSVIDLMHDAPAFNPHASSYLLASLAPRFAIGSVCIAVVDPGVGSQRRAVAVRADQRWFVGPDNGLFAVLPQLFEQIEYYEITWRPEHPSHSFHGRDIFAPVGAAIISGAVSGMLSRIPAIPASPPDLAEVIYIDGFGNAMTGLPADSLSPSEGLIVNGQGFRPANTFSDHPAGTAIWYTNSNGLIELSITNGNAADTCHLSIGDKVIQDL